MHMYIMYIDVQMYILCVCVYIDVCGYVHIYHFFGKDISFWTYFFLRINIFRDRSGTKF